MATVTDRPVTPALLNESGRPTRRHLLILGLCWAGWMFDFYDLMLFSFVLVPIQRQLGIGTGPLSLLLGASLAATALGGLLFGYLADRFGRRAVLSRTILVYSLGTFLCGFAQGAWSLLWFRVITGLGVGGEWATGQTLIAETVPAPTRGRFAAMMQTGAPLGVALASLMGGFGVPAFEHAFGPSWGWRVAFFVSALPALLVVLIRRAMPESDVWERGRGERHERRDQLAELLATPALRRTFLICLVLAVADMSAYWYTYVWLPKFLYEKLGFSMARSGLWVLVTQLGGFLGYLSFGWFADTIGRRVTYSVYCVLWAVGLVAVTLFWSAMGASPALTLAFMFLVGLGTGNFSGYGPIFAEVFPTRVRNTAMGSAFNLARGVQFFTPVIIAALAVRWGLGAGISLGAVFLVFGAAWVWMLPETRGRAITLEETAA